MRNASTLFIGIMILCTDVTIAATCEPGYYPLDGECTICPQYYACPDGENIIVCTSRDPAQYTEGPGATECTNCPTQVNYTDGFQHVYHYRGTNSGLNGCYALWKKRTTHSTIEVACYYSGNTYDRGSDKSKCMLTVTSCDAGYIPVCAYVEASHAYRSWWNSYDAVPTDGCIPAGIGYYSIDGAMTRTACPAGTSTRTDVATSVDECVPLCTSGIQHIKTGNGLIFNLYPTVYSSPALHVNYNGNVCYGVLSPGTANGAINIRYTDKVYHTAN